MTLGAQRGPKSAAAERGGCARRAEDEHECLYRSSTPPS